MARRRKERPSCVGFVVAGLRFKVIFPIPHFRQSNHGGNMTPFAPSKRKRVERILSQSICGVFKDARPDLFVISGTADCSSVARLDLWSNFPARMGLWTGNADGEA